MTEAEIEAAATEPDADPGDGVQAMPDSPSSISYTGLVLDGPWRSRTVSIRFPKGFLLVDKVNGLVWIYDRCDNGDFRIRSVEPERLLDDGPRNRWRAADEGSYDIRVLDWNAVDVADLREVQS